MTNPVIRQASADARAEVTRHRARVMLELANHFGLGDWWLADLERREAEAEWRRHRALWLVHEWAGMSVLEPRIGSIFSGSVA